MKQYILLCLITIFISSNLFAQIPNGGFESWNNSMPESWGGINISGHESITQTSFSHSGSSALNGKVTLWPEIGLYPPLLYSYHSSSMGFPVTERYNTLKGFYAFKPAGGDILHFTVTMLNSDDFPVGSGEIEINASSDNYTPFAVPVTYFSDDLAVNCYITMGINGPETNEDFHEGSQMFVDDLELTMDIVSDVKDETVVNSFELSQNYPNPFNPSTVISYQLPVNGYVTLKVFDMLGNEVATLINEEQNAGKHNYTFSIINYQLSSGIYFYKLQSGSFTQTKRMLLLK